MAETIFISDGLVARSFLLAPALGLGALGWCVLVVTLALRNGPMERTSRIAQLYGYTVCLVSVVTILFTVPGLVDNLFRLNGSLYGTDDFPGFTPSLTSFDAYKATYDRARRMGMTEEKSASPVPSDDELRRQYDALRAARLAESRFQARRELVRELLLLALAGGLFVGHWRWLRRRTDDTLAPA